MNHSNSRRFIPGIFENPLSKVKIARLYCKPVAAIKASARVIFFFCFNTIAISFISSLYGMIIESFRKALQTLASAIEIPGFPSNSISETKDTANKLSVYGTSRLSPSSKLIKILVSARKSIFTSRFFLVGHPIQSTFQCPKVFLKRRSFLSLFQFGKSFFNFCARGALFYCNNHNQIYRKFFIE